MTIQLAGLSAVAGYLIGSISMARLVRTLFSPKTDLSRTRLNLEGSDQAYEFNFVSASTVSVHMGTRFGFLTFILDTCKIALPTLALRIWFPEQPAYLIFAAAGCLGHIWPIYHRFRGGRGLAALYGGLFVIDWIGVFVTGIGGMLIGLFILRDVLTAYLAGIWLIIPWLWIRTHNWVAVGYAVFINIIIHITMIPDIRRYFRVTREGAWRDPAAVMQFSAMGRGIYKLARKLNVIKVDTPGPTAKPDSRPESGTR
jgi:glycerol-3-phosphate acyltransferase PlsY